MDQTETSVTVIPNSTQEFMTSQVKIKDERIAQLEDHIQKVTQRSYADSADRNRMVEGMKEWTLSELSDESITEEQAEAIAEIMGFELTTEFEVEVTVMYSVTVNARDEESAQNVIHDIDFDTVQYDSDNISWLSSSIDRIDIQQGATNTDMSHVSKLGKGPEYGHVNCSLFFKLIFTWGLSTGYQHDQDHIVIYDTVTKCPNCPMLAYTI